MSTPIETTVDQPGPAAAQPQGGVISGDRPAERGYAELPRHLISAGDLTRDAAIAILDTAERIDQAIAGREVRKLPTLRGRTVVNLFYEDSTRTRISFELAAKRLSADVINFSAKGSSVSKGESLKDTALTLQSMGADAVVIRHSASGAPERLTNWIDGTVVNAGDGTHEHPTQALLDAFTLRRHLVTGVAGGNVTGGGTGGDIAGGGTTATAVEDRIGQGLDGRRVVIVGDILHSRVARSNVTLLHALGAEVTLVAPPTLLPVGVEAWPCQVCYDFDTALEGVDAAMMLRVQRERMDGAFFPTAREYTRGYGLDLRRRALIAPHGIVMHPGPMNRGMEIAPAVADGEGSVVTEQVANGVIVRMAVLYLLVSGEGADRV
jgi:aspartate carbamoyltransferase catalytic subunit